MSKGVTGVTKGFISGKLRPEILEEAGQAAEGSGIHACGCVDGGGCGVCVERDVFMDCLYFKEIE